MVESNKEKFNKPQAKSSHYTMYMQRLDIINSLMGGTPAMREAGTKYLPQNYGENDQDYEARLKRTFLLNVFKRTAQKLAGQVFSEKVVFKPSGHKKSDEIMEEFLSNVDDNGTNITQFSEKAFFNGIVDGVVHILVDYPEFKTQKTEQGTIQYLDEETNEWKRLSPSAVKEKGWRPFWSEIRSKDVIGWRTEKHNGKTVLTQARIKETIEVPQGEFGTKLVNRIKVLEIGKYSIYEQSDKDKDIYNLVKSGVTTLDYIPLYTFMAGEALSYMTAIPSLEDLAYLNVEHWQSSSSQRNVLHFAREVTYFGRMLATTTIGEGVDATEEILIGHNRMITSEEPDGDLKIIEHSGKAIESGRNDLKDIKEEMSMFGLTYIMPKTGNTTATEKAIDSVENDSVLLSQSRLFEDVLNQCLVCTYEYLMIDDPEQQGSLIINKEFKNKLEGFSIDDLIKAGIGGILPKETIVQELINRKAITTEDDVKEIMALLNNELTLSGSIGEFKGSIGVKKDNVDVVKKEKENLEEIE